MKRKKDKKRSYGWIAALAVVAILAGFIGYMALNASFLRLKRATVSLEDLPPAFEGTTILYVSDVDLGGVNTPKRAAEAFEQLKVLNPDILLLGGDYTAPTLMDLLNQSSVAQYQSNTANLRGDFFHYISDFPATLGKYMIASPDDRLAGELAPLAAVSGFKLLDGEAFEIKKGSDSLWLVGLGEDASILPKLSNRFRSADCVVVLAYSPRQIPATMTTEAVDNGHWVDLALSGHTHGGQIRLFGRNLLTLDALEQQFGSGWTRETGVPILVTSGMGCEGVNLRLNTQPEAWLITLTSGAGE